MNNFLRVPLRQLCASAVRLGLLAVPGILTSCAGPARPPEEIPVVVSGFSSRESVGEDPLFDLKASQAWMHRADGSGTPSLMSIRDVLFTLFKEGQKSAVVSADTGLFYPGDNTVELRGGATYNAVDDSFHVHAEKMAWISSAGVLRCETDVEGAFRSFQFSADRLDIHRTRNVLHLHHATFVGPG